MPDETKPVDDYKHRKTQGEFVADLIERYCEVRESVVSTNYSPSTRLERLRNMKRELAAGLDEAFTEMIPRTLDDIL